MAEVRCRDESTHIIFADDGSIQSVKKRKILAPKKTIKGTITSVVTQTLINDAQNKFKNGLVCSPLSIEIILGMLAAGAEGETLKQLLEFLGHESMDQLQSESSSSKLLAKILTKPSSDIDFSLANGVWVDKKVEPIRACYRKALKSVYKTKAKYVDLENKPDEASQEINAWVKKKTKGLIPSIVQASDLTKDELVVFVNALYFKGVWDQPFEARKTVNKDFYLMNGEKVSVPFMNHYCERFYYGSFKGYKMIELPYECEDNSNEFSMYIFLPNEKDGLQNLLAHFLSNDALFHEDFDLEEERLKNVWIPKFEISCAFDPEDVMKQMGLTLPFKRTNTELSGIVDTSHLSQSMLYVSILQKAVIKVDEEGTEAAACSRMLLSRGGCPREINFVADHPFMFMIREDTSKAVLFVGSVLNPQIASGDDPSIRLVKKQRKVTPTATLPASTTKVVTKTLLDDARNDFEKGNFVCSPLSLEIMLGMLAAGGEGETLKQLLEFFGYLNLDQLLSKSPCSKLFAQNLSNPKSGEGGHNFSLVNAVWVDKKVKPVQSSYQEVLESVYKTQARYVDFENKANEAVQEINSWVHKETKGLIPTIVETSDFGRDDLMVLANALYFKGTWSDPFKAKMTKEKDFHLINGKMVSVPFMTNNEKYEYGTFEVYKMIKIPYQSKGESNKFSMYIFLPHEKDGLQILLELFHSDDALFHGNFHLRPERFDELWIPKFKISCKYEPSDVMKQMGLTLPFERTNNDFSRIVEPTCAYNKMLYVSKVLQKSFIEIDERGTEAAAISYSSLRGFSAQQKHKPPPPPSFVADHPFMFMIREDAANAVLFVGAVLNPHVN